MTTTPGFHRGQPLMKCFVSCLCLATGLSLLPRCGANAADDLVPAKFAPAKPPVLTKDRLDIPYTGSVTEVTEKSITIQWPGEAPKPFALSEILATGGFPTKPREGSRRSVLPSYRYRLADVKVGDQVTIRFAYLNGVSICDQICIRKRPGGRMPSLPEGAETLKTPWQDLIPYHERMDAYWDLHDKGIPYPEKFGPRRRWPVAPPPREVPPLGPAVDP